MNINFRVTNQKLVRTSFEQIVENSINYLFCNFEFSEDWNECSKNAYFSQNGTIWYVSEVNEENICEIPIEVIKHTGFRMYLVARDVNNNMKITTNIINLNVELSGNGEGEKPSITDINSETLNIERQGNIIKIEIKDDYTTDKELQNAINELETSTNEKLTNYYTKSEVDEIKTNINEKINNEKQELTNTIESVNSTLNSRIDNLSSSQEKALENAINDVKNDTANTYTTKVEYNTHKIEFENFVKNVNALLSSDDTTLDTLQEIVNYIKNNKDLLDGITVNKINYADIVDNLETALTNKVLSANQGVVLKQLIDELNNSKVNKETVGQLNNLTTTNKSNIVESINEVNGKQNFLQPQKPKGTYENLSALQTAYPNGASGVYLTSDNGHWYYWNGSQYVDGGVYQASEIADDSINNFKVNDTINLLFDYDKVALSKGYKSYAVTNWEIGYITPSNGNNHVNSYTVRNATAITLSKKTIVLCSIPSGFRFRVYTYNASDDTYVGCTDWLTKSYEFTPDNTKKYRFAINNNDSEIVTNVMQILKSVIVAFSEDIFEINAKTRIESDVITLLHQGGMGNPYPMNTIENFIYSRKKGFKWFETDVSITSDGVMVISHDDIRRDINNVEVIISQTTYNDLNAHQFYQDSSIKIPTIDQLLSNAKKYGFNLSLEYKNNFTSMQQYYDLYNKVKEYDMLDKCIFGSWSIGYFVEMVQNGYKDSMFLIAVNELPNIETVDERYLYMVNNTKGFYLSLNRGVIEDANITNDVISTLRQNGIKVSVFQCDTVESVELYSTKVDSITSNYYSVNQLINDEI